MVYKFRTEIICQHVVCNYPTKKIQLYALDITELDVEN